MMTGSKIGLLVFFVIGTQVFSHEAAAVEPKADEPTERHVLIVIGPSEHPPGTHEVPATGRLLKYCLESSPSAQGLEVTLSDGWPTDEQLLDRVHSVVFLGDFFPPTRLPNQPQIMEQLQAMMERGCGLVCIHFATGLGADHVDEAGHHPLLDWMGGYFATGCRHHQSVARVFEATIKPAAGSHPILRGWQEFTMVDEPYYNNYFGPKGISDRVTPIATSMLPPESPQEEVVGWAIERPDGGRGFAIVMPHFFRSWSDDNMRTMILNGIVWSSGQEIPAEGFASRIDDLQQFEPAGIEP